MMRKSPTRAQRPFSRSGQLVRSACVAGVALAFGPALGAAAQSSMQGVPNAMQGFSQNRDQPIQIEAEALEMRDKRKEATFSGHVKVVQGDTTMTSKTLVVFYESGAAQSGQQAAAAKGPSMQAASPGPGGTSSIKRLEAHGNVVVTQKDQVVTGQTAIFDTTTNLITMLGNGESGVVLTQCKNVLRGDRLLVNMTTGVSRVESDGNKVQGLFINSGNGNQVEQAGCGEGPAPGAAQAPGTAGPQSLLPSGGAHKPK